jgi:DNA recombination protein RmuC
MDMNTLTVAALCLVAGLVIGWLVAGRQAAALSAQLAAEKVRGEWTEQKQKMLDEVVSERDAAKEALAAVRASADEKEAGFARQLQALTEAKEALAAQFAETGGKLLDAAQRQFLERADARFKEAQAATGQGIEALIQPVKERLTAYEEAVRKVEAERRDAFGLLSGQIEAMRAGTERVSGEAAKLVNALRNAPKARGRWGEQQLRNVLETCGLSEHADFRTEVAAGEGLRPDVVIRVPGGQSLVIDAKVSLNAYQDAFEAVEEDVRIRHLDAHAASVKNHVNTLGAKSYWNQFDEAPDYVIMFIPGEHFLTAALDHDGGLWDYAFERRVLLATPTNLIAIARTVAAVWRQEKMAGQAREIAALGKELYARLATMGGHVARMGRNLDTAVGAYNALVGSLESQVLTQAKRFEELSVDTGAKAIEPLPMVDQVARPLVKLVAGDPAAD